MATQFNRETPQEWLNMNPHHFRRPPVLGSKERDPTFLHQTPHKKFPTSRVCLFFAARRPFCWRLKNNWKTEVQILGARSDSYMKAHQKKKTGPCFLERFVRLLRALAALEVLPKIPGMQPLAWSSLLQAALQLPGTWTHPTGRTSVSAHGELTESGVKQAHKGKDALPADP